ncbi:hypothetical protein ONS95_013684 [Cadophora gregata]|uniref:uncharacterized protein n=1 Tax=Cadophora gregata TaxID=51156 RepID=UPI0026DA7E74|nr:uncharacterized protein ONS95_013684 [Cadophora gregata]KAK0113426.1 hypothetical protein ONS96_014292 [Cadophora gregata f. sp. sojae]KAK0114184.1 hypothetical protein ONS95_013684 [Cadophora gregata]
MVLIWLLEIAVLLSASMAEPPPPATFYGIEIFPQAPITKFQSTLLIPSVTPDKDPKSVQGLRSMWPGLEPDPVSCLIQNVLSNLNQPPKPTVDNAWYFFPYWCCNPAMDLVDDRVRRDLLQNTYQWNPETKNWYQNWLVEPGKLGHEGGVPPFGGGLVTDGHFDTKYTENNWSPLVKATLSIELQDEGKWDFGIVEWRNVIIEAETNETEWCVNILDKDDKFEMQRTQPIATVNGNTNKTTCYIAYITFLGPN